MDQNGSISKTSNTDASKEKSLENSECSLGICDGSGFVEKWYDVDDSRRERCPCNPKFEEDMDDDS